MATTGTGANWYEVLGLTPQASDEEVAAATERLARQGAALATTSPERSQQLRDTVRTIRAALLAGPAARSHYDARLTAATSPPPLQPPPPVPSPAFDPPPPPGATAWPNPHPTPPPRAPGPVVAPPTNQAAVTPTDSPTAAPGPGIIDSVVNGIVPVASRFRRFLQSGWTCPSCGADGGPGDKFCARCGAAMKPEAPTIRPSCVACSSPLESGDRFCARCGTVAG